VTLKDLVLLTAAETAKLLKVSIATLRTWRYRSVGPPFMRLTGSRHGPAYYEYHDLLEWADTRRYFSTTDETVRTTPKKGHSKARDISEKEDPPTV
jgi:hypothetical protein